MMQRFLHHGVLFAFRTGPAVPLDSLSPSPGETGLSNGERCKLRRWNRIYRIDESADQVGRNILSIGKTEFNRREIL